MTNNPAEMPDHHPYRSRLRQIMHANNLNPHSWTKRAHVARNVLYEFFAGRSNELSYETLSKLAVSVGLTADKLTSEEPLPLSASDRAYQQLDEAIAVALDPAKASREQILSALAIFEQFHGSDVWKSFSFGKNASDRKALNKLIDDFRLKIRFAPEFNDVAHLPRRVGLVEKERRNLYNDLITIPVLSPPEEPLTLPAEVTESLGRLVLGPKLLGREGALEFAIARSSMLPVIRKDDRLLIDTLQTRPSPPGYFLIWDGLEVTPRYLQIAPGTSPPKVTIQSPNGTHTEERTFGDRGSRAEIEILGRVVWVATDIE